MHIYVEYGYTELESAAEIVKNNLFGIDIDARAAQLAYFAVMMKARQYDRRFFSRHLQPHVMTIQESNGLKTWSEVTGDNLVSGQLNFDDRFIQMADYLIEIFRDAKEYGSILKVNDDNYDSLLEFVGRVKQEDGNLLFRAWIDEIERGIVPLIEQAKILSAKYAVVATNPPYLNKYDTKLKQFINAIFTNVKGDLFSVFMYRNFDFCLEHGYSCFMTPMVWMFNQTYEKLRRYIIEHKGIVTLIQFEYSAYEEATVPICTFVLQNSHTDNKGCYLRLVDYRGGMDIQKQKALEAITTHGKNVYFEAVISNFAKVPSATIAYWVSEKFILLFSLKRLGDVVKQKMRINTGDNTRFLRLWFEVISKKMFRPMRWIPFSKGSSYRKWYGNWEYLLDYLDNGAGFKSCSGYRGSDEKNFFKEGIVWTDFSSGEASFRYCPVNCIAGAAGPMLGIEDNDFDITYILALLNSIVARYEMKFLCPPTHFQWGDIAEIPVIKGKGDKVNKLSECNISLCKTDWDSFETSWDFERHPLLPTSTEAATLLSDCYQKWEQECNDRFTTLKQNEEELNRIFIDIYGLQDELTPEVEDRDVTVRKADLGRDIKSFISYAVGCMMGRYSLDVPGLAYAGGEWDDSKYKTFLPDKDAILPICDDEYFDDDIVGRFVEFVKVVYGADTLEKNLQFIADALGGRGTPREVIRNYFLTGFYADHVKTYQKRPIYWLFDSGKKNGFKCLVYMHRYRPDTIARIRTDYVHEQQSRYRTMISDLENRRDNAATNAERVKMGKKLAAVEAQAKELREYEEKIHHLADQMIAIDLDDGVKHNYAIFKDVLAKIK